MAGETDRRTSSRNKQMKKNTTICGKCEKICEEEPKDANLQSIECEVCKLYFHIICVDVSKDKLKALSEYDGHYYCPNCEGASVQLHLRCLALEAEQTKIKVSVEALSRRMANCEINLEKWEKEFDKKFKEKSDELQSEIDNWKEANDITKQFQEAEIADLKLNKESMEKRLTKVEQIIEKKKIDNDEFPPLDTITNQAKKYNEIVKNQEIIDQKLKQHSEEKLEEKRKEGREQNLIIYGIPEQNENYVEQLKEDFRVIQELYSDRVNIIHEDIANLTRLGTKRGEKTRPIRITFVSAEKRIKFLRNNKNLLLYDETFPPCEAVFCNTDENHLHIYVSPDKTKQERELENKLRNELKERKGQGEKDICIRNLKIVKIKTQARWGEIIKNGLY